MFSFFQKKEKLPDFVVFMDKVQLYKWLANTIGSESCTILCFFEDTLSEVKQLLEATRTTTATARHISGSPLLGINTPVYIVDLFPMKTKFASAIAEIKQSGVSDVRLLTHLDDPFFLHFGGEKIKTLIQKLGMDAGESITHPMVTASIQNAQEKVESKVLQERDARNVGEWLQLNYRI